jgi:ubiquinone/menaquinone biosynthesis C-methylase UbiE
MHQDTSKPEESYDRLAEVYVARISHELEYKPFDRTLLDRFAADVRDSGTACDIGCGPGHVARYLHDRGVQVLGIDLSKGMVEQARRLHPDIEFRQGNMSTLDMDDDSLAGIVAFYSIIHIPREKVTHVLREFKRVLRPGGLLLLAFHRGHEIVHRDELWGKQVTLDFIFFERSEMEGYLRTAGFELEESLERPPYPESVEVQTWRVYIFARKPR